MISNERQWPDRRPPLRQPYYERERPRTMPVRPPCPEDTLVTREIQVERKHFVAILKENPRGRFLRIAEEANGRSNSIIIPGPGLREFQKMLEEIIAASNEIPVKNESMPPTEEQSAEPPDNFGNV
jgi:hypothetical protein